MFSGIVENLGKIEDLIFEDGNLHIWISCDFVSECHIDQSIAHNGVCLTVDKLTDKQYRVTAIQETLDKTNFAHLKVGQYLNLERSLTLDHRLDGHLVQGHIDCTIKCLKVTNLEGSWIFRFNYPKEYASWIVKKGSISLDGVSLTVAELTPAYLEVAIIPYTFEHTRFKYIKVEDDINVEFDVIGKYVARNMEAYMNK